MKAVEKFTNKFNLTKTIRMELVPENVFAKDLAEDNAKGQGNAVERAKKIADAYVPVKKLLDDYYRFSINKILKEFVISENEINELFDTYLSYKSKKDKKWEDVSTKLRKRIVSELKEISSETSGNLIEGTKTEKSKISTYLEYQLQAGLITKPIFEESISNLEKFKRFTGFFDGYMENRKNMFSDKTENTAIANRLVNDNLGIYFENCIKLEKIKQVAPELYSSILAKNKELTTLTGYSKLITQNAIQTYNDFIGHKSEDKFAKGINQIINEYKLDHPEEKKKIPYLNKLHNQILFRDVKDENTKDDFSTDEEVLSTIQDFVNNPVEDYLTRADELFSDSNQLALDGIFILPNKINKFSEIIFNNEKDSYSVLRHKLLENDKDILKPFSLKTVNELEKDFDVVDTLNSYLMKLIKDSKDSISELKILLQELLNGSKTLDKDRKVPKNEKDSGGKGFQQIEIIQKCFVNLIEINRFFTLFNLEKDGVAMQIENSDFDFYENLKVLMEFNEDLYLFAKVKNYLSRKPYSNDKIRIYFDNNSFFLRGFTENNTKSDNGTQYGGYLFRKKNSFDEYDYFLGCSKNAYLFRENFADSIPENDKSDYERLYYYQPKLKTIYNGYKNKDGKDYGFDKNKFKELISAVSEKNGTKISYEEKDTPTILLSRIETSNPELYKIIISDSSVIELQKEMIENLKAVFSKFVKKVPSLSDVLKKDFSSLKEFIDAVSYIDNEKSFYYGHVSKKEMESQNSVSDGENAKKFYLFKIQNKDLKERKDGKKSTGTENLHTMYFKALMSANQNCIDIGAGQVYFREKNYTGKEVIHPANNPIKNKTTGYPKENSTFTYDIRKDNRYFENKFFLHLSLFINFAAPKPKLNDLNTEVNKYLYANKKDINIIGIDRGERNLLYVSVINQKGEILYQRSLNEICYSIKTNGEELTVSKNYHTLLENRAKERDLARKSWGQIDNIKELKKGYLSQIVHELSLLMVRYNAIIVLEDLNPKMKQSRSGIDIQLYQKFEKALIDKLSYMVFKKDEVVDGEVVKANSVLNGMQLATPIKAFKDMKNQNGFIFYVWPQYTSKIDPITGFVSLFDTSEKTIFEHIKFFKKFKSIVYENGDFNFIVDDYSKFYDKKNTMKIKSFVISSKGERIINRKDGRAWKSETIIPSNELKYLFKEFEINTSENILNQITDNKLPLAFYNRLIKIFRSIVQLRNSESGNGSIDYISSPIIKIDGKDIDSFDSRVEFEKGKNAKLPIDADANGAYHIALKGLMALETLDSTGKVKISASNADWFRFVQEKEYRL